MKDFLAKEEYELTLLKQDTTEPRYFIDYAPLVFQHIRHRFKIADTEYMVRIFQENSMIFHSN